MPKDVERVPWRWGRLQTMNNSGKTFIEALGDFPPRSFENRFARIATRLRLHATMDGAELSCLFDGAYTACLCNIAFNGLGGCSGQIRPERELTRVKLEQDFMAARAQVFACPGWQQLLPAKREEATRVFLYVFVSEENLVPEPDSPNECN
jgi:hypothetical protein